MESALRETTVLPADQFGAESFSAFVSDEIAFAQEEFLTFQAECEITGPPSAVQEVPVQEPVIHGLLYALRRLPGFEDVLRLVGTAGYHRPEHLPPYGVGELVQFPCSVLPDQLDIGHNVHGYGDAVLVVYR